MDLFPFLWRKKEEEFFLNSIFPFPLFTTEGWECHAGKKAFKKVVQKINFNVPDLPVSGVVGRQAGRQIGR